MVLQSGWNSDRSLLRALTQRIGRQTETVKQERDMREQPTVTDFDDGEISVRLNGKELRGWNYKNETERRTKMLCAREYVEGWCDGRDA